MNTVKNPTWEQLKNQAIKRLKTSHELSGKDGALTPIIKMIIEAALEEELKAHLAQDKSNRKNGKAPKRIKTAYGNVDISPSRDRNSTYEPQFIKKRQMTLGKAVDHKIIALAARGMSHSDIAEYVQDIYGLDISKTLISNITDQVISKAKEWQQRTLDPVYVIVWMDAIHFKIREEGRVITKAVYCLLGLNQQGRKELIGIYIGKNESAAYWLTILNELKTRGVEDILIACIDNLKGFKQAITTVFPKTEIQQCIVHQIRNSMKHIASKFTKAFLTDLKAIYKAPSKTIAEESLQALEEKWGDKYAYVVKSWKNNWPELSAYFKYAPEVRKIIYTTNIIESFHSQVRIVTKTKSTFTSDMALLKLVFLATRNIVKKWKMPLPNWGLTAQQLAIKFGTRMPIDLPFDAAS